MCQPELPLPPITQTDSDALASISARQAAAKFGGRGQSYFTLDTRSMEPTLQGGDYTVAEEVPYDQLQKGDIVTYQADWLPPDSPPVTHRLVQKDKDGWIASGDNNPRSESWARVSERNYKAKVVHVYRPKNPTKRIK
jgi:signal peptidase I